MISVNVVGHIRMIETFLPLMRRSRGRKDGGRIVNVTSTLARTFLPMAAPYCLTKSAMNAFSSCLRRELATFNIDVVTVEPGGVFSLSLSVFHFCFSCSFQVGRGRLAPPLSTCVMDTWTHSQNSPFLAFPRFSTVCLHRNVLTWKFFRSICVNRVTKFHVSVARRVNNRAVERQVTSLRPLP